MVNDVLWFLLNIYIIIFESLRIKSELHYYGGWRNWMHNAPWNVWNLFEFTTLLSFFLLVMQVVELGGLIDKLNSKIGQQTATQAVPPEELYDATEDAIAQEATVKGQCVMYMVMTTLRMFKGFSAQPRLGLVTSTLSRASSDIAHFAIVFMCVFMSFSMIGMIIFGGKMHDWETPTRSMITCWRCLMGEYGFDEMMDAHDPATAAFMVGGHFS